MATLGWVRGSPNNGKPPCLYIGNGPRVQNRTRKERFHPVLKTCKSNPPSNGKKEKLTVRGSPNNGAPISLGQKQALCDVFMFSFLLSWSYSGEIQNFHESKTESCVSFRMVGSRSKREEAKAKKDLKTKKRDEHMKTKNTKRKKSSN